MIGMQKGAFGAALSLACVPAAAQEHRTEVAVGVLDHGAHIRPLRGKLPPNSFVPESGTVDIELLWRSRPATKALKPRFTAKLQVNTAGRTSFASVGAEWRQYALKRRVYGQIGIGVAVHDGYLNTPDPTAPGISYAEFVRRLDIYYDNASFGSRVLFNPNASLGVRLDRRWAVELAFEHYSHRRLLAKTNDGIEMWGVRLVRTLGK